MVKLVIEIDSQRGVRVTGHLGPKVVRALVMVGVGLTAVPWLYPFVRALGWV